MQEDRKLEEISKVLLELKSESGQLKNELKENQRKQESEIKE